MPDERNALLTLKTLSTRIFFSFASFKFRNVKHMVNHLATLDFIFQFMAAEFMHSR